MKKSVSKQEGDAGRRVRFRATLESAGKTATGFQVPEEVVAALGSSRRPPVKVTIKGYTWRNTVAVMGGVHMLGISAENRKGAGVAAGDLMDVELELDTEPREVTLPADFAEALDRDADAARFFETLSYSRKRQHILSIEGAKTAETRQRRIVKAIDELRTGG
jgi:hypothetical protein